MELNTALELLVNLATENEALKKELESALESAKNADSNLAYAMGASEDLEEAEAEMRTLKMTNEVLEEKVKELEEQIEGLKEKNWMLSSQLTHEAREEVNNYSSWGDKYWDFDNEQERQEELYSTDNLIYVSPNFQYVLQHATDEHMEKQAEMILRLYELVFASNAARKEVMAASKKLFEFMENGLKKGVQ